jgi:DNA-binding CsgD family transcriptional regulator
MLERARALRLTAWERQFGAMLANLDLHAGALAGALSRAESLLEEPLDPLAEQQVGLIAALARVDLGHPDDAGPLLERLFAAAAPDVTGQGDVLFIQAEAAFWGGRPAEALGRLDAYRAFADSEYPTSFLVDVSAAWAALESGRPLPDRIARGEASGMLRGAELERGAIEALARSDASVAASGFAAAAEAYRGFHRRGELRSGWAQGDASRVAGDAEGARAVLEAVEASAVADGFAGIAGRVRRALRLLGVRRSVRVARMDPSSALTPREEELSGLVGRGLTNAEIARRMGLGRPTVARILSSAMLKVGADTRTQLAARLGEPV